MSEHDIIVGIVLEEACLTVEQMAAACAVEPTWIVRRVEEGLFPSMAGPVESWRFGVRSLARARRIHAIERDFEAVPELAALVADMLEEIDELRTALELRRAR